MTLLAIVYATHLICAPYELSSRWGRRPVERCEAARVVVDFDLRGLGDAERLAFVRLADRGVADLKGVLGTHLDPAARHPARIRFVVSGRISMSRTYGRTVLLPLARVREDRAPYLHETVHALLPSPNRSTWLTEGVACYLESWIADNVGGYDAHVFTRAGDRGVHAAARRYARTAAGRAVLPWVGSPGEPPRLAEDRSNVARPFYVLAHSYTKYLVEQLGLDAVLRLVAEADPEGVLWRESGRSAGEWREAWLAEETDAR